MVNMENKSNKDGFKSFRVKVIDDVIRKMDMVMSKNNNMDCKNDSILIKNINMKIKELETDYETKPKEEAIRRYTDSDIFNRPIQRESKRTINNDKYLSEDAIKNLIKRIDDKILELENENKTVIRHCNSPIFDNVNTKKEVNKKELTNSEKRAKVFKKWDELEAYEKSINDEIASLNNKLADISNKKSNVIDELSSIIDERLAEIDNCSSDVSLSSEKLKKRLTYEGTKLREDFLMLEKLKRSVKEIVEIDDLKVYREKHLEEHKNRILNIVHCFAYIKNKDLDNSLYDEACDLVMSIADKHKSHYEWCKNLIEQSR